MSKTWCIELRHKSRQRLWGKFRDVIVYDVIDEHGEIHSNSAITADRMFIRPAKISSNKMRNKWHRVHYNEEQNQYFFVDREDEYGEPYHLCSELIKFIDELLIDDLLSGNLKLD